MKYRSGYGWVMEMIKNPKSAHSCPWERLDDVDWNLFMVLAPDALEAISNEKTMLEVVDKNQWVYKHLINPSDRVSRLHQLRWVL